MTHAHSKSLACSSSSHVALSLSLAWLFVAGCSGTIGDPLFSEEDAASIPDAMPLPDIDLDACQGLPLEDWYADTDGDSFGDPGNVVQACAPVTGYVQDSNDCDDSRGSVNPDEREICGDYLDNDCADGDPCVASMIAHWRFDEEQGVNASDSTGKNHEGVLIDGPSWTGTGLSFDGVDDYVVVQHQGDLHIDEGTVALWFRTSDITRTQGLWSKDHSGFGTGGHLSIYVNYNANDGTTAIIGRIQDTLASYTVRKDGVEANTWYHVVMSFGPGGASLRVNGQLAATSNYTGGLGSSSGGEGNSEPLAIGGHNWNSDPGAATPMTNPLVGTIHDVQIYGRELLPAEIDDLRAVYQP